MHRRRVLLAGLTALSTAVVGCLEDNGDEPTPENGEDAGPTPTPTQTPTPEENGDDRDPSDNDEAHRESIEYYDSLSLTETFYRLWDEQNWDRIDSLTYPGGVIDDNPEDLENIHGDVQLQLEEATIFRDGLEFFDTPSGIVEVEVEEEHPEGDTFTWTEQLILVVEDDEALVFDHRDQFNRISFDESDAPCPPEDADDAEVHLPEMGKFYHVASRGGVFDRAVASYRDTRQRRFRMEMEMHETVDEAEEVELNIEGLQVGYRDGIYHVEIGLLARYEHITLLIYGESADSIESIEGLFEETDCIDEEHIVARSWD